MDDVSGPGEDSLPITAAPGFELAVPLPPELLYRRCNPEDLPFDLCTELADMPGLIGQERAVEAVRFAIRMRRKGYNIFALGARGTGRKTLIDELLRRQAKSEPTPPDWCYVNNFADPQKPRCLSLPAGRGVKLEVPMKRLVEELRATLPAAFERDDYRARRQVIDQQFKERSEEAFGNLQQRAEAQGISLLRTPTGVAMAPKHDGQVLTPETFEKLPADERDRIQHQLEAIQGELEEVMRQVPQ